MPEKPEVDEEFDESWPMLKRELIADVVQNSIKATAWQLSGSQAMKAELMRAMVDVFNHVILYFANKWARNDADEFHNYGYGGYKNLAVIAPGLGFFFSGVYNTIFPFYATLYDVIPDELTINTLSLASIVAVNIGELVLFYLNLGDVSEDDGYSVPMKLYMRMKFSTEILLK
jgi:divalent metal cation (Fe/Co/Zn/Cd) transporter